MPRRVDRFPPRARSARSPSAASLIGVATVKGAVLGSTGNFSGNIAALGNNGTGGSIGNLTIGGDVNGASGDSSGSIFANQNMAKILIGGTLLGGVGSGSGGV